MEIILRCTKDVQVCCPVCGSYNIVATTTEHCHCGQCATALKIELIEKVKTNDNKDSFEQ